MARSPLGLAPRMNRLKLAELEELFLMHKADPQKWNAESLSKKFGKKCLGVWWYECVGG